MKKHMDYIEYSVTTTEDLRNLCIKNNWFTEGTNSQYEKLFYANKRGCSIDEIATIIWLCTPEETMCRRDILEALKEAQDKYYGLGLSF